MPGAEDTDQDLGRVAANALLFPAGDLQPDATLTAPSAERPQFCSGHAVGPKLPCTHVARRPTQSETSESGARDPVHPQQQVSAIPGRPLPTCS